MIAIRGIGVVSAMGDGVTALVDGLRAARAPCSPATGIGYPGDPPLVGRIDAARYPSDEAGALAMLDEAVDAAAATLPTDTALYVGTGGFLYASGLELYRRRTTPTPRATPFSVRDPAWGARHIAARSRLRGPIRSITTGCSSSANALLLAIEALQRHEIARALVVGAECVSAVTLSGFDALMLLDPAGCRPFDRDRAGMRLGDAVTTLVLERGDGGDWELAGGANRCDVHHLTSASPDGAVMREVMAEALQTSGVAPDDVTLVKAHGTGTIDSDAAEAAAIRALFAAPPPVIGLKGYLGHTLGACGTLEIAALVACLREGFVPGTLGFAVPDPELGLEPARAALPIANGVVLANFFGFGGNYTSLVLARRR